MPVRLWAHNPVRRCLWPGVADGKHNVDGPSTLLKCWSTTVHVAGCDTRSGDDRERDVDLADGHTPVGRAELDRAPRRVAGDLQLVAGPVQARTVVQGEGCVA